MSNATTNKGNHDPRNVRSLRKNATLSAVATATRQDSDALNLWSAWVLANHGAGPMRDRGEAAADESLRLGLLADHLDRFAK